MAVQRVVVLGGGSAGWLTAATLAAEFGGEGGLQVSLVESAEVPTIGVGEGTWPSMRATLHRLGLDEMALLRECDAAFKQGSCFDGWANGQDRYYHPFTLPHGHDEADLVSAWLQTDPASGRAPFADSVVAQPQLCEAALAPKLASTPAYGAVANYGYHFDAVKLGLLLRRHATEQLGVRHVVGEVCGVRSQANGDIAALQLRGQAELPGELFIDCSGLAALLIGQHFGVPLRSAKTVLFNDSALAVQLPHADANAPLASATVATAQPMGWTWDIGLPTRRGVGLVFSSAHGSAEAAEQQLRAHLERGGARVEGLTPRLIRFEPGWRERFWHRNCVAVGLAAGFIEPLEASALALVEMAAAALRDGFPATRDDMDHLSKRFNESFSYRWARTLDFLKLHYALSRRDDSDYWQQHREASTQPESLRELLQLWRHRPPSRADLYRSDEMFPVASYQYVLYGMGFEPAPGALHRRPLARARTFMGETQRITRQLLGALPRHRDLIHHYLRHGMPAASPHA